MIQRKNGRPIPAPNPPARKTPTAPPVYRPGPTPLVLQTKKSRQAQPANAKSLGHPTPPQSLARANARPTHVPPNNRPAPIAKVLQRKTSPAQPAVHGRIPQQRSFLNNRIIQRAVDPLDQAKQAAAHFGSAYAGDDPDTDFGNWYEQGGYPLHGYGVVSEEFYFPIKIKNLDLQLVPISQTLQAIPNKKVPGGIRRETKATLELLVNNYNVQIPKEVGDIFPQYGIRPDQRKHYLRIKTALVALGRYVAELHTAQDPMAKHEAMMLKHVKFVDNVLEAFSGRLCHNDCSKGLLATLQLL